MTTTVTGRSGISTVMAHLCGEMTIMGIICTGCLPNGILLKTYVDAESARL